MTNPNQGQMNQKKTKKQTGGDQKKQKFHRGQVKELLESIGITENATIENNVKWTEFTKELTEAIRKLYIEKKEQYKNKLQTIDRDDTISDFVEFINEKISSTGKTKEKIQNIKEDVAKKYADKKFESILIKFTKNNIYKKILEQLNKFDLKKAPSVRQSSRKNPTTTNPNSFENELKKRHKKLFEILKTIYETKIGLHNFFGILKTLVVFSQKPEFLTNKETPLYLNYSITGLPGTGKTYIANVLGQILQYSGILLYKKFSILESFDMIGEYVGQSGPKTANALLDNLESVVFIDEAYNIARCSGDMTQQTKCKSTLNQLNCSKFDQYSTEACTEMVKFISENPGNICIIVAGYQDGPLALKNTLFRINEGLSRRFPSSNRIYMKPVSKDDAITKVKNAIKSYNLQRNLTSITGTDQKQFYEVFLPSLTKLQSKNIILKENFSSLNMMIKDFVEWLILKSKKKIKVDKKNAEQKLDELFLKYTLKKNEAGNC